MRREPAKTIYTERLSWPPIWWVLFLSPAILVLILVALQSSGSRTPGFVVAGAIAVFGLAFLYAFRALEIVIDDERLTVGYPIHRERVPLDAIVACRPITYRWWQFGGYGIRWKRRGKMINIGGDGGRAVELRRDGRGALFFSSRDPAAVCAAIGARRPEIGST